MHIGDDNNSIIDDDGRDDEHLHHHSRFSFAFHFLLLRVNNYIIIEYIKYIIYFRIDEDDDEINLDTNLSSLLVDPVPNWYELTLEEIYEKINPSGVCKKTARVARSRWAKTLQKTLGVVANNLLREMKKKKFVH